MAANQEEECPVCLELLPVDAGQFIRATCCGKGLHKECHAGIGKSTMTRKQKNTCVMCRAKHPKTDKEANKRVRAWVKKGKAWAQATLATAYALGDHGLPQSYLMAVKLYGMAVKQGDPSAMMGLGNMYDKGQGVDQSYEKSAELFKMAADRGHASAQFNLGCSYNNGEGVAQSNKLAREWYTKAAAQGHEDATGALKRLDQREGKTATPTVAPLLCSTCGTPETIDRILRSCKQCHTTQYCSTACQRKHWREGGHSKECMARDNF
jgi:TPR repeat protein